MLTNQDEIERAELLLAKARSTTDGEASALVYRAYRCLAKAVAAYDETETEQNPGYRRRERRLARDRRTTDEPRPQSAVTIEPTAASPVSERNTATGAGRRSGDYRLRAADRVTRSRAVGRNRTEGEIRAARGIREPRVTAARDAEAARLARFYYVESQVHQRGEHVIDLRA